jgi:hypothetical protein
LEKVYEHLLPEALISSSDFGSFSGYLKSIGHVPQQQCLALTMFVIWDKFEFVLAQIK